VKSIPSEPVVDPEVVERLRSFGDDGDQPFLVSMIEVFLHEARGQLAAIRGALAAGDPVRLWRAAHALRGACGNVGATRLAAICEMLEMEGRGGSLGQAGELGTRAEVEFALLSEVLEKEKGNARRMT